MAALGCACGPGADPASLEAAGESPTAVQAGPLASGASLSALDYYQIKQLFARFSHGLDSAARDGELFADTFTADGVLAGVSGATIEGRDQLAAFARSTPNAGPTNVGRYITNVWLEAVPGGVIGRSDVMIATRIEGQPRGVFVNAGEYRDLLVRTAEGWRIQRRDFHRVGAVPPWDPPPAVSAGSAVAVPAALAPGETALDLTAGDYAEIEQLYAKYSYGFDTAADRGRMWAGLFAPDGFHRNYPNQYILGHEALAEFAYNEYGTQAGTKTPLSAVHFITQTMLERSDEGVVARSYLMYVRQGVDGQPSTVYPGGVYIDLLTKLEAGWRFQEKTVILNNGPVPAPVERLVR